jgi:hypothetical protein
MPFRFSGGSLYICVLSFFFSSFRFSPAILLPPSRPLSAGLTIPTDYFLVSPYGETEMSIPVISLLRLYFYFLHLHFALAIPMSVHVSSLPLYPFFFIFFKALISFIPLFYRARMAGSIVVSTMAANENYFRSNRLPCRSLVAYRLIFEPAIAGHVDPPYILIGSMTLKV